MELQELSIIAKLLGEENEKRLKDSITDLLLEQIESDMEEKYKYDYIVAFDEIFEVIKEEIGQEFRERLVEKYRERIDKELEKIFPN